MLLAAAHVDADSTTSGVPVSAVVVSSCTITTASLNFGSYDPVVAHRGLPLDATGTLTITCTQGASATIGLDAGTNGANAAVTTRAMMSGNNYLSYEIYQDPARTIVWGNTGASMLAPPAAPSFEPRSYPTYGRIPAGQSVPAGSLYIDTVRATVNF